MNDKASFSAVLFDYNGVLVDDEEVHLEAFRSVIAPLGLSIRREEYWEKYLGLDDHGAFEAILNDAGRLPTQAEISALIQAKKPVYMRLAEESLKPFDGAAALVNLLALDSVVGIVSGALRDEILLGMSVLGIEQAVSFVVSAEDTRRSKPDPEGYELGVRQAMRRSAPEARGPILAVEDSLAGIEASKAAGLLCLAVGHTYSSAELLGSGADAVVGRISEVSPLILDGILRKGVNA